ncbi:hypothetical protein N7467_004338 [Penicillium canescens]|nr:hypothetical protein N7467_004338 [Penicillium canescens]
MAFIAKPLEERVTCWPTLPNVAAFESLPYPASSSWDSQSLVFPMDGLSIDNTALRDLSQETWNQPSISSADGSALSAADCGFQTMNFPPAALVNPEDPNFGHKSTSPIQSGGMTQPIYRACSSPTFAKSDMTSFQSESFPNLRSSPEDEPTCQATRRKRAHNVTEKRYRESLNLNFLQLENVLSHRRPKGYMGMSTDKRPERVKRVAILAHARDDILELRAEVKSLKESLSTLREAAFPNTCKFTLHDD